jgi:hypothetical protein
MKINEENLLITDGRNPKKQSNKWIALINIPIQMGLSFLFAYGGNWLDENYP